MFILSVVLTLKVYTLSILLSIPDFAIPASRAAVRPAERFPHPSTEKHFAADRIPIASADPLRSDLPVNENGENRPQSNNARHKNQFLHFPDHNGSQDLTAQLEFKAHGQSLCQI